jgi:hypothetical protein
MLRVRSGAVCLCFGLAALLSPAVGCGGDGAPKSPTVHYESGLIGPAGGVIRGPGGVTLSIPEGALTRETQVQLTYAAPAEAPRLPPDLEAAGKFYSVLPQGLTLAKPAMVTVPYEEHTTTVLLMAAEPGEKWTVIPGATVESGTLTALVKSLSFLVPTRSAPLVCNPSGSCTTPA